MSSKKPVPMILDVPKVKKREVRDPRFDPLCREFDKKQFAEDYNFLSDMRMKDIKAIRTELKETSDPEKQKQLRRLLQRLNDQHKATRSKKIADVEAAAEKKHLEQQFLEGRQPRFKNKSDYSDTIYSDTLKIHTKKKDTAPKVFKRENKNRPREMSSKKPVPMILDVPKLKKREVRDPRFDPLCREFDKKQFAEDYNFLSDMRMKDIKAIRTELKETSDPEKQKQLRRLLQRLNDQHKATRSKKIADVEAAAEKKHLEQQFLEGRQPRFKNKCKFCC